MLKKSFFYNRHFLLTSVIWLSLVGTVSAQFVNKLLPNGTEVSVQGKLADTGSNANGSYDFQVCVCDTPDCSNPPIACQERMGVQVIDSIYNFTLDFGTVVWDGNTRSLQFAVRRDASEQYVILAPTQPVTNAPYAIRSVVASEADGLSTECDANDCVQDQYIGSVSGSKITGQIPGGSLPTDSNSYIQNITTQQSTSNFNISGTGKADIFDAATQYNIGSVRFISGEGGTIANTFVGFSAGDDNTTGFSNTFVGASAGEENTTGSQNSFFGAGTGDINTTGSGNSFFGSLTGEFNTTGDNNSYFGTQAGSENMSGDNNSFFGGSAGLNNLASNNSFFGASAGVSNTDGFANSYFGRDAGRINQSGDNNSFFGRSAGFNNTANNSSFFGSLSGEGNTTGSSNSFFGFSSGRNSTIGSRNSFFGLFAGENNQSGFDNSFFGKDAGRGSPTNGSGSNNSIFGSEAGVNNTTNNNSFFGYQSGNQNTIGSGNSFFGINSGKSNTTGTGNTFMGADAGRQNVSGSFNTMIGFGANTSTNNTTNNNTAVGFSSSATGGGATAIGAFANATVPNTIVLGTAANIVQVPGDMTVSGTLSKGGGSFKIDHPLDPKNKFLFHSFVESPDMMNVYNGNVTTSENGEATVQLPDYFEALNKDFRYQLTVIGQFAQAIVFEEIKDNRFKIKTDKPTVKVSWQITGIRQDPFAEKNRIKVEAEKSEREKGSYLYPELYKKQDEKKPEKADEEKENEK